MSRGETEAASTGRSISFEWLISIFCFNTLVFLRDEAGTNPDTDTLIVPQSELMGGSPLRIRFH